MPRPREERVMRLLSMLIALVRGRLTGLHRLTVRGHEYVLFPVIAGAEGDGDGGGSGDAGGDSSTAGGSGDGESGEVKKDPEVEKAYGKLREAEKRAADAEKAAKDTAERLKAIEDKDATELEKAQGRVAELEEKEATATQTLRDARLIAELSKPKYELSNAEAAAKLIEGVEFDDDHHPQGVEEAVTALLADVPGLKVEEAKAGGGSPANPPKGNEGDVMSAEDAKTLATEDPDKFNDLFEDGKIPASAMGG